MSGVVRSRVGRRSPPTSIPLTGCGTLDALDRRIREEFERARRYDVTFALVLLDIDGMRNINERLGRDGGHRVLADLGRLLQRELRAPDFVARYGGEEFLLLLPETDLEAGRQTVHRIRDRLGPAGLGDLHLGVRLPPDRGHRHVSAPGRAQARGSLRPGGSGDCWQGRGRTSTGSGARRDRQVMVTGDR